MTFLFFLSPVNLTVSFKSTQVLLFSLLKGTTGKYRTIYTLSQLPFLFWENYAVFADKVTDKHYLRWSLVVVTSWLIVK